MPYLPFMNRARKKSADHLAEKLSIYRIKRHDIYEVPCYLTVLWQWPRSRSLSLSHSIFLFQPLAFGTAEI